MADNALLFKYLVKSLGMKHGITPSFMAKPWGNVIVFFATVISVSYAWPSAKLPGCSGSVQNRMMMRLPFTDRTSIYTWSHIHVSLRDNHGNNAFAIETEGLQRGRDGAAYDELKYISQTAEYFLAGVLDGLTDGEPTLNSRG
jgi:glutamine synthetase